MSDFTQFLVRQVNLMVRLVLVFMLFFSLQLSVQAESDITAGAVQNAHLADQRQANTSLDVASTDAANTTGSDSLVTLSNLNSPIIDQANILSPAEKQQLSQQILQLYQQGKAQVGIVIVRSTGSESIFDFAMRVGEQWKLGSSKTDNGVVIAVAVDDRRIHIATGYGLEGVLPDIVVGQIIRNQVTPAFKQGQFALGIQQALSEIEQILNLDPQIAKQAAEELQQRQQQAVSEQKAKDKIMSTGLVIFFIGTFASMAVGKKVSAATSGVTGFAAGMIYGSGFITSLLVGFGLFFLIVTPLAQLILQAVLSGRGGGGGGRGGGSSGGYGGGGGRFGGGGASGSW